MAKLKRLVSIVLTLAMLCTTLLSNGMIAHASMLPLEEVKAYLVLNGKTNEELKSFVVNDLLDMLVDANGNPIEIKSDATTAWRYIKADEDGIELYKEYKIDTDGQITDDERIDLSYSKGMTSYQMELIIGKNGQLNVGNKRYIIKVYVSNEYVETLNFELYERTSNGNREVEPIHIDCSKSTYSLATMEGETKDVELIMYGQVLEDPISSNAAYLNLTSERAEHPSITTKVYDWESYSLNASLGFELFAPVTDEIWEQDMSSTNAGYSLYNSESDIFIFVVNYYVDEELFDIKIVAVSFAAGYITHIGELYLDENGTYTDVVNNVSHSDSFETDVWEMEFELKENYTVDKEYNFKLDVRGTGAIEQSFNSVAQKAVLGHYDSLEDASGQTDIKDSLLSNLGYKANYSGNGIDFTVFFPEGTFTDGDIKKFTIKTVEYKDDFREFTDKPIIGEADPWLRVTGASSASGKEYDTYVIENGKNINMDTYYGYGYQTIFINDASADLSSIKPEFWYANTQRVYAVDKNTGNKIDSDHTRNFNSENQQYTGIIIDKNKENERNYWVTFKKLNNNGPELFVYGPNEREVILDEYFEFKHDILIANIGNAPLEDIKVELIGAENVKLDPYWTVGGAGNDTLAAFTTTEKTTQYGEIASIAKIRLLPDGDGTVKGTLVITAKGQDPVLIAMNGTAQTPEIITETLDDAVKYVPYQHIIATNNMHDWVETKFSVIEGQLPAGITLNEDTGEIYGVPTVPNESTEQTYSFTVKATFLVDGVEGYFESATKQFSIKVKPNTDENVYLASDANEGYYIEEHIGTEDGQYHYVLEVFTDTVFKSNGEFAEFKALWLNGEKLVVDVDYDAESGSTKITIKGQTFENKTNTNETNTIAMEFRNDDNELNRTSQNFVPKTYPNVDKVIAKINALPSASNITLSNKSAVQSARTDYNALSSTEKNKVTNYSKLVDCENRIAQLEVDQAAANAVIAKINAIPSSINYDAVDKINAARTAYDALTSAQKKLVTNEQRLLDAEAALKKYEAQEADKTAAAKVEALIRAIPATVNSNAKDEIKAARNAYDALNSTQKGYVGNATRLIEAENALRIFEQNEADKAEANKVVEKISAIPSNITLNDKETVNAARTAYSGLTASQKGYVTNYDKLTSAEEKIVEIEAEAKEQAAVNAVIAAINDIPNNLTLNDKSKVTSVRAAYNALTSSQKEKVVNYSDLTNAEDTIAALEAQENANKADKQAADTVIAKINALPDKITLVYKTDVQNTRTAYNALTQKQKDLVTNYSELTDAEATIKALEDYEAANKTDQDAAKVVIGLIENLPNNITLTDKEDVVAARNAYDSLTDKQKQIVTNYDKLTAAEVKIAELEDDNYEEIEFVTFVGILVDKNGNPYADKVIEIHSVVQNGRSDENGSFQFNNVEFGNHTIFVKNDDGSIVAQKSFNIKLGSPLSISDAEIVAENGAIFTVRMEMDGSNIKFLTVEEGNKAPVVDTDKGDEGGINIGEDKTPEKDDDEDDGINIGDADKDDVNKDNGFKSTPDQDVKSAQTGDDSNFALWYTLLLVSLGGLIVTTYSGMRKRKYVGKHQR